MSFAAMQWAWDQDIDHPAAKLLLLTLAWHHNDETGQCNPGIDRLVALSNLSRSTVFRGLSTLLSLDVICYDRRRGASNNYVLNLDRMLPQRERNSYVKTRIPQALRKQVWERDAYRCRYCNTHLDLTCDHIVAERHGGQTVLDNLQTLCRSCNSTKGAKKSHEKSQPATKVSQTGCQNDTQKEKGSEKKKDEPTQRSKLTAMTEDWCADEGLLSWAAEHHPLLTLEDLAHETDRFRDHWISKAERRADWRASWRNWIRNAARFAARSRPISRIEGVRRTNAQRINEAMARHGVLQDDRPADRPRLQLIAGSDLDAG